MPYFDGQDTERKTELTARDAAQLQLNGHSVTDEEGNLVTVLAEETLNDADEKELESNKLKAEHVKSVQGLTGDEPEIAGDTLVVDEPESEDKVEEPLSDEEQEKQAQLADPQTAVIERDHSQDGPAHANNPSGYAPTGL